MPMNDGQKKVIHLPQIGFNAADYHRTVGIADLFGDHADGVGSFVAQRLREKIRSVVQFLRGGKNAVLGFLRNRVSRGSVVENNGNRARSQAYMLRHGLECNDRGLRAGPLAFGHGLFQAGQSVAIRESSWRIIAYQPFLFTSAFRLPSNPPVSLAMLSVPAKWKGASTPQRIDWQIGFNLKYYYARR